MGETEKSPRTGGLPVKNHITTQAIKANSAKCILEKLIKLGSNFDVASAGEIRLLSKMGVSGEKMIYANPVKTIEGLIEASKVGKAKGQMWLSLITRLLMIFIILRAAILQSVELFYAVVGGFFLAFILYMIHLIIFVYHKNME